MRADEFTTMSTLEEFNLKKAAAAGAMALGALGANAQGIMPGDQPEIRVQQPQAEVVRNGEDIIVKYEGKPYQGVVLSHPDTMMNMPIGAIKIRVPQAQFGERGIGSYDVYLARDKAYIVKYRYAGR
jgi:hypothetical protein